MKKMTLEDMKRVEFDMLSLFAEFCEKNSLRYFLMGGTLLGAIRHNGFIPWDDDIDVAMPYPDYERFITMFEGTNGNKNIEIWYDMKRKLGIPCIKMVDLRTRTINEGRDKNNSFPVWIDIFPMFALSDNDDEAHEQLNKLADLTQESWRYMKTYTGRDPLKKIKSFIINKKKLSDTVQARKAIANMYPYGSTTRITSIYRAKRKPKDKMSTIATDAFDNYIYHQFESGSFRIPKDYDGYLTRMYGDYMQLPPEEERLPHPFEAYWRD